ncbi:MAG: SDR family oxidoreductase [Rhodothermales bacterium]
MVEKQRVFVIGGSSGIGRATAAAAAASGAEVVIIGRNEGRVQEAAASIPSADGLVVDVRDIRALDACLEEKRPIDHLVFSAAELTSAPFAEIDIAEAKRMFDVKFWGAFAAVQSAARFLPEGGSATLFSGVAARHPIEGLSVVAAINGAIEALVRALAMELSPRRVNAVSPGFIDSHGIDDAQRAQLVKRLPARRVGTPGDVAHAVLMLMKNPYVTGTVLSVDGGRSII